MTNPTSPAVAELLPCDQCGTPDPINDFRQRQIGWANDPDVKRWYEAEIKCRCCGRSTGVFKAAHADDAQAAAKMFWSRRAPSPLEEMLASAISALLDAIENQENWPLEATCNECTQGQTPIQFDKGLCAWHKGLAALAAWNRRPPSPPPTDLEEENRRLREALTELTGFSERHAYDHWSKVGSSKSVQFMRLLERCRAALTPEAKP